MSPPGAPADLAQPVSEPTIWLAIAPGYNAASARGSSSVG